MFTKSLLLIIGLTVACFGFEFTADLTLENLTNTTINFRICRGQVFDGANFSSNTQNSVAAQNYDVTLGPRETKIVTVTLICIDSNRPAPEPGTPILPAPLQMQPNMLNNPSQNIDDAIQRARERYGL